MFNPQNLRTEAHLELKKANNEWTDCVAKNFLPKWLAGEAIDLETVCPSETMLSLSEAMYAEKPLPFKSAF